MRISLDIDDALIRQALRATGLRTKKAAVEEGLRLLIKLHRQRQILALGGNVRWQDDLNARRSGRFVPIE